MIILMVDDKSFKANKPGSHQPKKLLTDAEVQHIRMLKEERGFSYGELAIKFKVPKHTIASICAYRRRVYKIFRKPKG